MLAGALQIEMSTNIARLTGELRQANTAISGFARQAETAIASVSRAFASLGVGVGFGLGIQQLIALSDQYTKFTAQLKLATTSTAEYGKALSDVRQISKASQTDLGAVGVLYARIANGTRELGISQQRVANITETVSLALKASGATTAEAASAMLQLSQAFGSGVLRGQEFNAVNEAAPRLMKALADGIGVPVGQLRAMAEAGKITSEVMANALPKALAELRGEAAQVQTIAGAFVSLKNNVMEFIGTQSQANGSVAAITGAIGLLAENLRLLMAVITGVTVLKLTEWLIAAAVALRTKTAAVLNYSGALAIQAAAALEATLAEGAKATALVATLRLTQAAMKATADNASAELALMMAFRARGLAMTQVGAATTELTRLQIRQAGVSAQLTAALAAETVATRALDVAQKGVAASGLARFLGLLGGPIGWITTILSLGATAWVLWGDKGSASEKAVQGTIAQTTPQIVEALQKQIDKLNERNKAAAAGVPRVSFKDNPALNNALKDFNDALDKMDQAGRGAGAFAGMNLEQRSAAMAAFGAIAGRAHAQFQEFGQGTEVEAKRLRGVKLDEWMVKYATDAEKLAAKLDEASQAFGGLIPPEVENRIRESFGKKDAKADASELLKYENALKSLEDQLGKYNNQTVEEKMVNDLARGSLKGLAVEHQRHLIEVARAVDLHQTAKVALDAYIKSMEADAALEQEVADLMAARATKEGDAIKVQHLVLDNLRFEAKLVGMTNVEREKAIALRALETSGIDKQGAEYARLVKSLTDEIQAKAAAEALNPKLLEQMEFEITLIGMTNVQREQAIALRALEATGIDQTTKEYKEYVGQLKNVIAAKSAADEMRALHVGIWQDVDRVAHDTFVSIFDSGKNTFDRLRDTLKNGLYSLLYNMTLKPFLIQIVTSTAGAGVAQSVFPGAAGAGGGGGGIGNLLSTGNSLYNGLTGNTGSLIERGASFFGVGGGAAASTIGFGGAAGSSIGLTSAGVATQSAIASGSIFGSLGPAALGTTEAAGAAIGASLVTEGVIAGGAGVVGAAAPAAGAMSGAMAGLAAAAPYIAAVVAIAYALGVFGKGKTSAVGTGYLATGATTGSTVDESFFGGITNKARGEPLADQAKNMRDLVAVLTPAVEELGKVARQTFGVSAESFASMRTSFSGEVSGIGQENVDKLNTVITLDVINKLSEQILPGIKDLQKENEQLIETFVRLGGVMEVTKKIVEVTGADVATTFGGIGLSSLELRNDLIELMGGLNSAASQFDSFYQNFFTGAERFEKDQRMVNDALRELGVSVLPRTREQYRQLVYAQNLNTVAGQEMFAALIALSPAFAAVTQALDELGAAADTTAARLTRAHEQALDLIDDQIRASERAGNAAHDSASAYRLAATSMREAIRQLRGGDLSPLLPGQKLAESRTNLDTVFQKALSGDKGALAALPDIATDFLEASRAYNASSTAYTADFQRVMDMLAQSGAASDAFGGIMDYQSMLLDIQTGVLREIHAEMEKPDPVVDVLEQHTALLASVQRLLVDSTRTLITINSSVLDQTGYLISGNSIVSAQTGEIMAIPTVMRAQTSALLAGNYMVTDPQTGQLINISVDQLGRISSVRDALGAQTIDLLAGNYLVTDPQTGRLFTATIDQTGIIASGDLALIQQAQELLSSNASLLTSSGLIAQGTYLLQDQSGRLLGASVNQLGEIISLAALTRDQTGQIVTGQSLLNAQTGYIISGNALINAQTGQITTVAGALSTQTGLIITGNSTDDAIRNLTALNSSLSAEMLMALVSSAVTQDSQFGGMLGGIGQMVALLQTIVTLTDRRSAEELATAQAMAAIAAAAASAAAEAQRVAAEQRAAAEAAAAIARVSTPTPMSQDDWEGSEAQALMRWFRLQSTLHEGTGNDALGLPVVPYDEYLTRLHKGEAVIDAATMSAIKSYGMPVREDDPIADEMVRYFGAIPSHATGLPSVPYDGYTAELHRDEVVMDAPFATAAKRYGFAVHGGGSDITKADIDRLCASVEKVEARIAQSAERNTGDLKEHAKVVNAGQDKAARDIGRHVEGRAEAMDRR